MTRRYSIYLTLIAMLVAANLVRWWMHSEKGAEGSAAQGKVFLPEDFRLRMDFPATAVPRRNLFQPNDAAFPVARTPTRRAMVKTAAQPPAQHEQIEAQAAGGALGKLKLLGVVFRDGKGRAYLSLDKESVIAFAGDTVLGQFNVEKVDVDAVELRDLKNNTTRRIPVSGK